MVEKERNILIAFSDGGGYYSLILYQNSASGTYLKLSCKVALKTISMSSW